VITALASAGIVLLVAVLKGAIGFGFPTVATPVLALFLDMKTVIPILVLPNLAMDGVQARRAGSLTVVVRRLGVLVIFGGIGMVLGTRLFVRLPSQQLTLMLGAILVLFVVLNATRVSPRVPPRWEPWLSPPVGFAVGIIGGITNVPGTPLVMYFYALGMEKPEFVGSVAVTFIAYKLVQLVALVSYGAFPWRLVVPSLGLTAVALAGFAAGLRIQDRLDQKTFNRGVLGFLAGLGVWLVYRATR
jgi:uncharacterized protein